MTDVVIVVIAIITISAGLCGHATQPWPLRRAWRWLHARLTAPQGSQAPRVHRHRERPAERRTAPLWARTQPHTYEETA